MAGMEQMEYHDSLRIASANHIESVKNTLKIFFKKRNCSTEVEMLFNKSKYSHDKL